MDLVFEAAKAVVQAAMEHNSKIKQTNEITKRMNRAINLLGNEIKEYILKHSLEQFKGHIRWYQNDFTDTLDRFIEERINKETAQKELSSLISRIGLERDSIDFQSQNNPQFYSAHVHPVLISAVSLQIAAYSELSARFEDYTSDEYIIRELNYLLEKHYEYYTYKFHKSYDNYTKTYFNHPLFGILEYKSIISYRKFLEYMRYKQLINLNGHFQFRDPEEHAEYSRFVFVRCTQFNIKQLDDGRRVLAVNNKDGQQTQPSIYKDIKDIPTKSSTSFNVSIRSFNTNRDIELVIWEIKPNGENVGKASLPYRIKDSWEDLSLSYEKIMDETTLRFEIYWNDALDEDIYVKNTYIEFSQVEAVIPEVDYKEKLPLPDYLGWGNRSTNKSVFFELNNNYSSSLYFAANDVKKTFESPSIFYDLSLMWCEDWARLNVSFEIYLKTRNEVSRTVNLCIHELYPIRPGSYDIRNSVWSEKLQLSTEWQKFNLSCERKEHTQIRFEIYWNDYEEIDIMIRDIKVSYTLK
ncbi:hypothetical protein [Bacillus atrophaeus]|uniref:hypothetical protein n=1 Tax=Bacillus atrophaeus TaxID=1452 RepID=UPI002281CCA7|nr:hypothetical protein [Bacillus atrophaeus]MCY8466850.1 hypothetical protein [Bacillus atrophaeus]MCY8475809.1 hypothetical protein [Bacillus atrophaeus]